MRELRAAREEIRDLAALTLVISVTALVVATIAVLMVKYALWLARVLDVL